MIHDYICGETERSLLLVSFGLNKLSHYQCCHFTALEEEFVLCCSLDNTAKCKNAV